MGKFWLLLLILLTISFVRMLGFAGQAGSNKEINEDLKVTNYPEFSKNIQYFQTNEGRIVTDRWPMFEKGDILYVDGEFLAEKSAIWFPKIEYRREARGSDKVLNMIRESITDKANLLLGHKYSELLLGMLIGRNDLTPELADNLKSAGIIHVVVVSGQNLTMVFAFLAVGARYFKRKVFLGGAILLVSIYVLLVGFDPPVVRAYLMILSLVFAELTGRKYSSLFALFATGAMMLAFDPVLLGEVSFQLSFLASVGVILGIKTVASLKLPQKGTIRYVAEVYITSFFAWIMTTPLIIMSFGTVSVVAPIVNLLLLWSVPIFMVLGLIVLSLPSGFAVYIANFLEILMKGFLMIVEFFAKINQNLFEANSNISLAFVIFSYILIFTLIKLIIRYENKK